METSSSIQSSVPKSLFNSHSLRILIEWKQPEVDRVNNFVMYQFPLAGDINYITNYPRDLALLNPYLITSEYQQSGIKTHNSQLMSKNKKYS